MVGVMRTPPLLVLRKQVYSKPIRVPVANDAGHSLSRPCPQQSGVCAEPYMPLQARKSAFRLARDTPDCTRKTRLFGDHEALFVSL